MLFHHLSDKEGDKEGEEMSNNLPVEEGKIPSELAEVKVESTENGMPDIYHGASMLKLSKKEIELLSAPVDEASVNIRPDGLLYLPQVFVREKLNETFGQCGWAWIHLGDKPEGNKLGVVGALYVRSHFVAKAVGEADYYPNSSMSSWPSTWESGKSDSIVRCCKDLGIGKEMWQPRFCETWTAENAIKVKVNTKKGLKIWWRRKNAKPFEGEIGEVEGIVHTSGQPEQETASKPAADPQTTASRAKIATGITAENDKDWLEKFAQTVALQEGKEYGDIVQDLTKFPGNDGVRSVAKLSEHPKWLARTVKRNRPNPDKAPEKKRANPEEQTAADKAWWAHVEAMTQEDRDRLTDCSMFMQMPTGSRMNLLREVTYNIDEAIKRAEEGYSG